MKRGIRLGFGIVLTGATLWALGDAVNSSVTHSYCRSQAIYCVSANKEFQEALGPPVTPGPWYNDSIAFSHKGHIVSCEIRFDGSKSSSDVIVRAIREQGWHSTILYNTVGPRKWKMLTCEALRLENGARVQRFDLQPSQPQQ